MPKSLLCACGIRHKAHDGKNRRNQLPDLKTDRYGNPRPRAGHRTRQNKEKQRERMAQSAEHL